MKTLINVQVDSGSFWREINERRHKSNSDAGLEINFGGINVREPLLIATEWGKYFKDMYTPVVNTDYDIDSKIGMANELRTALDQTPVGNSDTAISLTEVEEAVRECKKCKPVEKMLSSMKILYMGNLMSLKLSQNYIRQCIRYHIHLLK